MSAGTDEKKVDLSDLARKTYHSDGMVSTVLGLITIVSIIVAGLAIIWLGNQQWGDKKKFVAAEMVQVIEKEDGEEGAAGPGIDETSGGAQMTANEAVDTVEADVQMEETQGQTQSGDPAQLLDSVLGAVEAQTEITGPVRTSGTGGPGAGEGSGGTGTEGRGSGSGIIPKFQRWIITYGEGDIETYAKQLDYFGIEIGVVQGTKITYVSNFDGGSPKTRIEPNGQNEKRIYFIWKEAKRKEQDARLIAGARVSTADSIVVHYYSNGLVKDLEDKEAKFANREKKRIRSTRFKIQSKGKGEYEFVVEAQTPK